MNATERTQVAALRRFVNFGLHRNGRNFTQHMAWLLDHEPDTPLTPRQKYMLVELCYRYRRQLGGRVHDSIIPLQPPVESDYVTPDPASQGEMPI